MGRNNASIGNMGALEHIYIRRDPDMIPDLHVRRPVARLAIGPEDRVAVGVPEDHVPAEKAVVAEHHFATAIETAILIAIEAAPKLQMPAIEANYRTLAKRRSPLEIDSATVGDSEKRPVAGNPQATAKADAHPQSRGIRNTNGAPAQTSHAHSVCE